MINKKFARAIIVLQISSIVYFIIGLLIFYSFISNKAHSARVLLLSLLVFGFGLFIEFIIKDLKKQKFWAWVAAIIIASLYLPSIFIIFG
ncbi:MAG: hypothetical protein EXS55_00005, partial [Candidatus Magasanikbacteria bacterium]|nr:hypothetical protein [Candidatus Magasanikbacteria bacterium]